MPIRDTMTLISPQGEAREVPIDQVAAALEQGFTVETDGERFGRLEQEQQAEAADTVGNAVAAGVGSFLSGATLGGTDLLISGFGSAGDVRATREARAAFPTLSTGAQIAGAVVPAIAGGFGGAPGALARATPAGRAAEVGLRIAEEGAGKSALKATGYSAAGGAIEGAAQNAGAYLSDVALENRPLSAEAFVAAVGQGALWGGAAGGTFSLGQRAITNAKRLFPKEQVARESVEAAEREAVDEIDNAVRDADAMRELARDRLRQIRLQRAEADEVLKQQLDEIKLTEARRLSEMKLAREAAKGTRRRTRKALGGDEAAPPPPAEPAPVTAAPEPAPASAAPDLPDRVEIVRTGKPSAGTYEVRTFRGGAAEPEVRTLKRNETLEAIEVDMPAGFKPASSLNLGPDAAVVRGIPAAADIQENTLYVFRPSELGARGVSGNEIHPEHFASIQSAWKEGKRLAPVDIDVTPEGKLFVEDGNHRLLAAAADDRPVVARFRPTREGWKPQRSARDISDRFQPRPAEAAAAPSTRPGATPAQQLEAALVATKTELDAGKTLGELSARPPATVIEDALNDAVAKVDPEAAALVRAERKARMSKEEIQAWIDARKAPAEAERGTVRHYVESATGDRARGIRARKLDRIEIPIGTPGSELRRAAFLERESERLTDAILAGDDYAAAAAAQQAEMMQMAAQIRTALRGTADDLGADITKATEVIGKHEEAAAELTAALGQAAPPTAARRAVGYRSAVDAQAQKMAQGAAEVAAKAEKAFAPDAASLAATGQVSERGRLVGRLADVGGAMEIMRDLGLPMPDPRSIPVIGPVLGLYLKARGYAAVFRRLGGKMPASAETAIASRSAAIQGRVRSAVHRMLGRAERGAAAARRVAPSTAAVLSHKLFDGRASEPPAPRRGGRGVRDTRSNMNDLQRAYRERLSELAASQRPGALRDAVLSRVRASDPALNDAIASVEERKAKFLWEMAPRAHRPPSLIGSEEWGPSAGALSKFARYVEAAEDPAGVLERMAETGEISLEAVETLRVVYPELYNKAVMYLLDAIADDPEALSYQRRVQLSTLFRIPLDPTTEPEYVRAMQEGYEQAPAAQDAGMPPGAAPAPMPATPALAGDVMLSQRAMPALDRRGAA